MEYRDVASQNGVDHRLCGAFPSPEVDLLQFESTRSSNSPFKQRNKTAKREPRQDSAGESRRQSEKRASKEIYHLLNWNVVIHVLVEIAYKRMASRIERRCSRISVQAHMRQGRSRLGSALAVVCPFARLTSAAGRTLLLPQGHSGAEDWAGSAKTPSAASPCRSPRRWPSSSGRLAGGSENRRSRYPS